MNKKPDSSLFASSYLATHLVQAFRRNAARPALTVGHVSWSYQDLWRRAASVAHGLADGTHPVALIGSRSAEDYAAVLGIFLSGRPYMPLNPSASLTHLKSLLTLSGTSTVLCARDTPLFASLARLNTLDARVLETRELSSALPPPQVGAFAYIISSSGSSGPPKAIPITLGNFDAYLRAANEALDISASDRTSQIFDLSFDLSLHDIFISWLNGAHLHVATHEESMDLLAFANQQKITCWFSTPSHARKALLRARDGAHLKHLRLSMFCGEPLSWNLARSWGKLSSGRVENWYGPTEATIAATRYIVPTIKPDTAKGLVPIGRPFGTNRVAISHGGELFLSGPQVFGGYLGHSQSRRRMHGTGDIASKDTKGNLRFERRKDGRVKLRGEFVDLSWIEARISELTEAEVVVLRWPHRSLTPDSLLVILVQNTPISRSLTSRVAAVLPKSLNLHFLALPQLPLTASGKRDVESLAKMAQLRMATPQQRFGSRFEHLVTLAQGVQPKLSPDDLQNASNLMQAGLDSLAFTQFVAHIEARFHLELSQFDVAQLAQMTLRQIAQYVGQRLYARNITDLSKTVDKAGDRPPQSQHHRAMRAVRFLETFPHFLRRMDGHSVPLIGSSGFMRGLDTQAFDEACFRKGHRLRSINIGMGMLSNRGIGELCAFVAEEAKRANKRFPIAVFELELLQLSVLPPAGDIEVLEDFKAGRLSLPKSASHDPDTLWDVSTAGTLAVRQGPWRPREMPAKWEKSRHQEIRQIFDGQVALDPTAIEIWFAATKELRSVSDQVAVVLHPLDGHVSCLRSGSGHLADLKRLIEQAPRVSLITDDSFDLASHHFRNFSHLNEREGRVRFSRQLAVQVSRLLDGDTP